MAKKRSLAIALTTGLLTLGTAFPEGEPNATILYEVVAVKGKLVREEPAPEVKLRPGDQAASGSLLRTGWKSSAEIVVPEEGAHFTLGSRTQVRLSGDGPGVILEVGKGRLRAVFDKLTSGPTRERNVVTPSAILAVRGTEYGVAVSKSGETNVVVFSGVVDVTDLAAHGPAVSVQAGEYCMIRRGQPPSRAMPHEMDARSWDKGHMPGSMSGHGSGSSMGHHNSGHSSSGSMGHGG
jgi:hypothetical protein